MKIWLPIISMLLISGCAVSKNYHPAKKFAPAALQEDYQTFRNILEESHPSLYWYTPKDSIDLYFEIGRAKLNDSLTEGGFRNVLSFVVAKIRCGHTSIRPSKAAVRYVDTVSRIRNFPLTFKVWDDTVLVTSNMNRRDTVVKRGVQLTAIEGKPVKQLIDSFFSHLSADGLNTTHKYQTLSNAGVFRSLYNAFYGLKPKMEVQFLDSTGNLRTAIVSAYNPASDSGRMRIGGPPPASSRKERKRMMLLAARNLRIDTALQAAIMDLSTFSKHYKLRSFFRHTFKRLDKEQMPNLIIDLRANGGGSVTLSNLLTKYMAQKPFKIADSLYAISNRSRYGHLQNGYFLNRLFFIFMSRKKEDGNYHFRYFEERYFKPKKRLNYKGNIYILTGGNTFSAATLVTQALKPQENVFVVGEETGGGAYGNTAWLIPDVTFPNTRVRMRLPLFRLVIDKGEKKGFGVMPEIPSVPNTKDIQRNADYKMEKVRQLIWQHNTARRVQR
jgi:hypothetical protein